MITATTKEPDELLSSVRRKLLAWLAQQEWDTGQLKAWLQGYDLPAFGHDEEPYLWLLRALPCGNGAYEAESELAGRVARLLEEKPDEQRPGDCPEELLYNLLLLCAGLACPDQLAEPLHAMFQRRRLEGAYRGLDLRAALRAALIHNQRDSRLRPIWDTMLEGRQHEYLPGGRIDGWDGIERMPESEERRGYPALEAIGAALAKLALYLDPWPDREAKLKYLLEKLQRAYPGQDWAEHLREQGQEHAWPEWAVGCLPELPPVAARELGVATRDPRVRKPLEYVLRAMHQEALLEGLYEGRAAGRRVSGAVEWVIHRLAVALAENHRNNPFDSYGATMRVSEFTLAQAAEEFPEPYRKIVRRARIAMLTGEEFKPGTYELPKVSELSD